MSGFSTMCWSNVSSPTHRYLSDICCLSPAGVQGQLLRDMINPSIRTKLLSVYQQAGAHGPRPAPCRCPGRVACCRCGVVPVPAVSGEQGVETPATASKRAQWKSGMGSGHFVLCAQQAAVRCCWAMALCVTTLCCQRWSAPRA
jgi:hypothetical protein